MKISNNESRNEYLIESLINDEDISDYEPQSRNEQFLKDIIVGNPECTLEPETRSEALYKKLHKKVLEGGGGGITLKYIKDNIAQSNYKTSYLGAPFISNDSVGDFLKNSILSYETLMKILNDIDFFNMNTIDGLLTYSIIINDPEYIPNEWTNLSFSNGEGLSKGMCPFQFLNKKIKLNKEIILRYGYSSKSKGLYLPLVSYFTETYDAPLMTIESMFYEQNLTYYNQYLDTLIIKTATNGPFSDWKIRSRQIVFKELNSIIYKNSSNTISCFFDGTYHGTVNPYSLSDGKIFVPDNLVDSFKSSTNWSYMSDHIFPLSDPSWHFNRIDIHNMYENETQHVHMVLNEFTVEPSISVLSSNENSITIENIKTSIDEVSFDIISHGIGSSTLTINVDGEYSTQIIKDIVVGKKIEITLDNTAKEYFEDNGDGWYIAKKDVKSFERLICKFNFTTTDETFNRCRIGVLPNDLFPDGCSSGGYICVDDNYGYHGLGIDYSLADKRKCYCRYYTSKKLSSGNHYVMFDNLNPGGRVSPDYFLPKGTKLQIRFE